MQLIKLVSSWVNPTQIERVADLTATSNVPQSSADAETLSKLLNAGYKSVVVLNSQSVSYSTLEVDEMAALINTALEA